MAKQRKQETNQSDSDKAVTTVKVHKYVASIIRKLCAHLNLNQEEVLERYAEQMQNDLFALMAKELGERRPK